MINVDRIAKAVVREYPKLQRVLIEIDDYNVISTVLIMALADHVERMPLSLEKKEYWIDQLPRSVRDAIEKKLF